ncbi:PII-like signaling protein [Bradyrhizobium japonicum]
MMATEDDLFLAILAMDAYNRGYNPGMEFSGNSDSTSTQIGDATVLTADPDEESSFYAIAYSWAGKTVISYRGTTFEAGPNLGDILNGWTLSAGYSQASQAQKALNFYTLVQGQGSGPIQLTGHSLGGGLAGFVSDLTGAPADVFNNIPFGSGVVAQILSLDLQQGMRLPLSVLGGYDPLTGQSYATVPSSSASVRQFITLGEVATGLRASTLLLSTAKFVAKGLSPSLAAVFAAYGAYLDNTANSQILNSNSGYSPSLPKSIALHSQALMVLELYANVNGKTDWASIGSELYDALFNDTVANSSGFVKTENNGWYLPSARMMAAIGYSAIDGGAMPFGNTAIQSLFSDADTLGLIQATGKFRGLLSSDATSAFLVGLPTAISPVGALAEIAVQFAADQAAVASTSQGLAQGALKLDGSTLKVDLDPSRWTKTFQQPASSSATTAILGVGDLFDSVLANVSAQLSPGELTSSWISSNLAGLSAPVLKQLNEITEVDISLGGDAISPAGTLPVAHGGSVGGAMLIGQIGQGAITGSDHGNDIIIGGATVTTGDGNDIILAGGSETISVGEGDNLILVDSSTLNLTLTYLGGAVGAPDGGSSGGESGSGPTVTPSDGTDVIIGNLSGADTFTFTNADLAAFTVVWAGSGSDTFNINTSTSTADVNIVALSMSGINGANLANLDAKKLEAWIEKTYGLSSSDATLVILNPSASDKLTYNGKVVSTPTITLGGTNWSDHYGTLIETPPSYSVPWTSTYKASGAYYVLASANFGFDYHLTQASTRELSLQSIVHKVTTSGTVSVTTGGLGGYQRNADFGTTYLTATSTGLLNLINYNPGDFGIGLPGNGLSLESLQKETLYDQFGTVISNITKQASPATLYDPSLTDASHNRPTVDLANYLKGSGATDPTNVSVSFFAANKALLDGQFYGFTVRDTAANVSSALTELNKDSKLTGITLTDSGVPTLNLTVAQILSDTTALSKIANVSYAVSITDTASNVSQIIDAINADLTISSINLTDTGVPSLALTTMQALLDTAALAKISNPSYTIAIFDTGAVVAANLDALNGNAAVSAITLLDSGTPSLNLTVAQLLGDTNALGAITNATYSITVEDTATNILANASTLSANPNVTGATVVDTAANVLSNTSALNANTQIHSITVVDTVTNISDNRTALQAQAQPTSFVVIDTAANILASSSEITNATDIMSVGVVDAAANIAVNIDALNAIASIGWIEFTDSGTPVMTLTATQAVSNSGVLARLVSPNYAIHVVDTAAAIVANIDALSKVTALAQINLTDPGSPTLTLTAAQAANDADVTAKIANLNAEIVVSDATVNVAAQLHALNANSRITSITLTGSGSQTLTLTVAQLLEDATALGKITNADVQIVVSDTAANVSANFDALNADAALSSVSLTGSIAPTLILTAGQAANDLGLLTKISSTDYTIAVFDSVSNILSYAGPLVSNGNVSSINAVDTVANVLADAAALASAGCGSYLILDTASNVAANIDAIKANTSIRAISLTDSGMPTLVLTIAQTINDAAVLSMVANATFAIEISGTSAEFAGNINSLAANTFISNVTLTDAGAPTFSLSADEAAGNAGLLSKITNTNYVVNIVDTASRVSARLDALNALTAIGVITLTDPEAPELDLTVAQTIGNANALARITNPDFVIAVTDNAASVVLNAATLAAYPNIASVSIVDSAANILAANASLAAIPLLISITVVDVAANIVANETELAGMSGITVIEIVDSAANVAANLDTLNANGAISQITLSDAEPVLILTAEQAASDYFALGLITNAAYSISIIDSAANVSLYLGQLAYNPNLKSIALTDSGTPTIDLYSYVLDSGVLSKITNSDYAVNPLDASNISVSTFIASQALLDASPGGFSISDYASNVSMEIDALNGDASISSITLIDYVTPNLELSASQVIDDFLALDKITNSIYTISVTGSAGDIVANSSAFAANGRITSVTVRDTAANVLSNATALNAVSGISAIVVDTAANVLANEAALNALALPLTITVQDTAAAVSSLIDQLNVDASLSAIVLTDAESAGLTLTVAQAVGDSSALSKIVGPSPYVPATYRIAIVDTAANVAENLDELSTITQISLISLTDSQQLSLVLGVADTLTAQIVLGHLSNASYSVAVVDTAANIAADLDLLRFDAHINAITVQDADVITVTAEQAVRDATVLALLVNASVNIVNTTNISVAEFVAEQAALTSIAANFSIADTAANVSSQFDALNADPNLSAIMLSDSGVPTLTLTVMQALEGTVALAAIANASYGIAISDTAANVAAQFDALNYDENIVSITFTDGAVPTLALTAAQYENDSIALGKISSGSYVLSVVGTGTETIDIGQALQISNFEYDPASSEWVVRGPGLADDLSNVASVLDGNGHRFLLVGGGSQYSTAEAAVAAASDGDSILLTPGSDASSVDTTGKVITISDVEAVGSGAPVILDLDGNGVDVSLLGTTKVAFDMAGDGWPVPTAWVGPGDAFLAIDPDGRGIIDQAKQIEFTQWAPGTASDMQALRQVFDTNHNGELEANDAMWSDFRIWQDANSDGISDPGEVRMLDEAGITSINLNPTGPAQRFSDGSVISGLSSYTRSDGTTGLAGDVALAYSGSLSGAKGAGSIDSQISQLVQAMSTYSANNTGSDAAGSSIHTLPSDTAVQGTVGAAWHA